MPTVLGVLELIAGLTDINYKNTILDKVNEDTGPVDRCRSTCFVLKPCIGLINNFDQVQTKTFVLEDLENMAINKFALKNPV